MGEGVEAIVLRRIRDIGAVVTALAGAAPSGSIAKRAGGAYSLCRKGAARRGMSDMGPVNWLAVGAAVVAALLVSALWYGPLYGRARLGEVGPGGLGIRNAPGRTLALSAAALFITAAMMGHMFARVGAETLAAKPWLYFMMSGGLAIAFVIPALWTSYAQQRISTRLALIDAGFWLAAYLAMGAVFWVFKA